MTVPTTGDQGRHHPGIEPRNQSGCRAVVKISQADGMTSGVFLIFRLGVFVWLETRTIALMRMRTTPQRMTTDRSPLQASILLTSPIGSRIHSRMISTRTRDPPGPTKIMRGLRAGWLEVDGQRFRPQSGEMELEEFGEISDEEIGHRFLGSRRVYEEAISTVGYDRMIDATLLLPPLSEPPTPISVTLAPSDCVSNMESGRRSRRRG